MSCSNTGRNRKALAARSEPAAARNEGSAPGAMPPFSHTSEAQRIHEERIFRDAFDARYSKRTVLVGVNEASAISARNPKRSIAFVGTMSLSSCIGFAAYDPDAKVGAAAHLMLSTTNPAFEPVDRMLERLIETAAVVGGRRFALFAFNGRSGKRSWNDQLREHLESAVERLKARDVVSSFEHRDEHNFVLDSRNGRIFTVSVDG